jgi:outer membrane protein insertion porin family
MVLVRMRAALLASVFGISLGQGILPALAQGTPQGASQLAAISAPGTISSIKVEGNQRIEAGTVISYLVVQQGDAFDPERLDRSLKSLYATGLFSDVALRREGSVLVVRVVENPIINHVAFEGNKKTNDEHLRTVVQLKPRSVFTPALAQIDRQKILDEYAKKGRFGARVDPKIIKLDQNRVDLVYEIDEGADTYVAKIAFVGNHVFSESRLREVISSREEAWWRFLTSSDSYDPERLNYDRELLRRFYLHNGYADIDISNPTAELAPDRSAFFVSFTVKEAERYQVGKISVKSSLRNVNPDELRGLVDISEGDWYDGSLIEGATQAIADNVRAHGYAFVDVKPVIKRNADTKTIDMEFDVGEGPRVYVERIDIAGNVRTEDKVVRREFRLAEGDAFNADLLRRSRQRIEDTGYFQNVTVNSSPGSTPDKAIVNAHVDEKSTGELTFGGGYSTDVGALLNVGLKERNLIGSGIEAGISGVLAQKQTQVDLSATNPYFLDRNLVAGIDLFAIQSNLLSIAAYEERRVGASFSLGYELNEHLRQNWTYSLVERDVYNVQTSASLYVQDEAGQSLLSQIGQTISLDYRDSRIDPKSGFIVRLGTDFAGLGGDARYVRTKIDGQYLFPLEKLLGDPDYVFALSAGSGYMFNMGVDEHIIDRFFLGGDNLRGFQTGGVGPHAVVGSDSLGGRFMWTQSSEFRFPLPVSADLGLSGRVFVDIGALSQASSVTRTGTPIQIVDSTAPRLGAGFGFSWKTPFGLINIDFAPFVVKQKYDQTQFFRFGFGTRF